MCETERNLHAGVGGKKGLVSSYDPSIGDIDFSKSIELTPSGAEHYYWCINDTDYAHTMLEVTPITDRILFRQFSDEYYHPRTKFEITIKFITYLENEDMAYCKVPDHVAYNGQKFIRKRLDWQKQLLERNKIAGSEGGFRRTKRTKPYSR
ncbi:hypothetical protein EPD60_10645 [Flaviaesturariibacter flavus]|uniref:Uncharacterized protein n=1 Tax=Flaviaesturariibacter flavus TaxID=2502780 RepID=A0A4R1BBR1_9BACT|nr:hypothetical protein [Flaviaesturariibacter flavus]TCJ14440.1 hypothetical protein EPD60_10645 [Flaviaesturariibacter flavus]